MYPSIWGVCLMQVCIDLHTGWLEMFGNVLWSLVEDSVVIEMLSNFFWYSLCKIVILFIWTALTIVNYHSSRTVLRVELIAWISSFWFLFWMIKCCRDFFNSVSMYNLSKRSPYLIALVEWCGWILPRPLFVRIATGATSSNLKQVEGIIWFDPSGVQNWLRILIRFQSIWFQLETPRNLTSTYTVDGVSTLSVLLISLGLVVVSASLAGKFPSIPVSFSSSEHETCSEFDLGRRSVQSTGGTSQAQNLFERMLSNCIRLSDVPVITIEWTGNRIVQPILLNPCIKVSN